MARRLTLEGVEVAGVFEIMPHPNGLGRNIVQCLEDFDIPLHLSTTVVEIHGRDRLEKVTVAPVDAQLRPRLSEAWDVECDTLLLSIGLIPDNELAHRMRLRLDPVTSGPVVSSTMETSVDGIFACGNGVHIHDLVDFVSEEATLAGRYAGLYVAGSLPRRTTCACCPEKTCPIACRTPSPQTAHMWCTCVCAARWRSAPSACSIPGGEYIYEKKLRYVVPAEMVNLTVRPCFLENFHGDALKVDVLPR